MLTSAKTILLHFGIAVALALLVGIAPQLIVRLFPDIGWHLLTAFYLIIACAQITFYLLTTFTGLWLTILSFVLNFILWVAEQVNLESFFHDAAFYQDERFRYGVIVLGGLLWAFNKLVIDRLYIVLKVRISIANRADRIVAGWCEIKRQK